VVEKEEGDQEDLIEVHVSSEGEAVDRKPLEIVRKRKAATKSTTRKPTKGRTTRKTLTPVAAGRPGQYAGELLDPLVQ